MLQIAKSHRARAESSSYFLESLHFQHNGYRRQN